MTTTPRANGTDHISGLSSDYNEDTQQKRGNGDNAQRCMSPGSGLSLREKKKVCNANRNCFMVKTWARHKTTGTVRNNGWRLAAVGGWWRLVAVGGGWPFMVLGGCP